MQVVPIEELGPEVVPAPDNNTMDSGPGRLSGILGNSRYARAGMIGSSFSALACLLCCSLSLAEPNVCHAAGLSARDGIDLLGNSIGTDSFNSANPIFSTQGLYDPTKASTNGDLFCLSGLASLGNACIKG